MSLHEETLKVFVVFVFWFFQLFEGEELARIGLLKGFFPEVGLLQNGSSAGWFVDLLLQLNEFLQLMRIAVVSPSSI